MKRLTLNEIQREALSTALDLYIDMTRDMLFDYKDSPGDLEDVKNDVKLLPVAEKLLKRLRR